MKNIILVILIIAGLFLFMTKEDPVKHTYIDTTEPPKKTELDTPINTYKKQVEALSIANTLQNPNSYVSSRVNARDMAKETVNLGNNKIEEQNNAIENLIK